MTTLFSYPRLHTPVIQFRLLTRLRSMLHGASELVFSEPKFPWLWPFKIAASDWILRGARRRVFGLHRTPRLGRRSVDKWRVSQWRARAGEGLFLVILRSLCLHEVRDSCLDLGFVAPVSASLLRALGLGLRLYTGFRCWFSWGGGAVRRGVSTYPKEPHTPELRNRP